MWDLSWVVEPPSPSLVAGVPVCPSLVAAAVAAGTVQGMPSYLYACAAGHTTTASRPIDDRDDAPACETCGTSTKRQLTAPGISFRGDGFYSTSHRRG